MELWHPNSNPAHREITYFCPGSLSLPWPIFCVAPTWPQPGSILYGTLLIYFSDLRWPLTIPMSLTFSPKVHPIMTLVYSLQTGECQWLNDWAICSGHYHCKQLPPSTINNGLIWLIERPLGRSMWSNLWPPLLSV